jgi:hypothetical protein
MVDNATLAVVEMIVRRTQANLERRGYKPEEVIPFRVLAEELANYLRESHRATSKEIPGPAKNDDTGTEGTDPSPA